MWCVLLDFYFKTFSTSFLVFNTENKETRNKARKSKEEVKNELEDSTNGERHENKELELKITAVIQEFEEIIKNK